MTSEEVWRLASHLKLVFDIVRLVDVAVTTQYSISDSGEIVAEPYHCYAVWNKGRRCENCISAKAFATKGKMTKFEFVGQDVYHVMAMYLEVDETPYVMEMVSKITDEILFGAYGKNEFVESISRYNQRLYIDPVTGAYNRQYYETQIRGLPHVYAVAMLDVDDFKHINDTYGHMTGDLALRAVAGAITSCVRNTDAVIRYGGDEFLLIFREIPQQVFSVRLEAIRQAISKIALPDYPALHLSASLGGVYCHGSITDMIQEADARLYQAKAVKNKVQC